MQPRRLTESHLGSQIRGCGCEMLKTIHDTVVMLPDWRGVNPGVTTVRRVAATARSIV